MLRIGLMLNQDRLVPAWANEVLTEIENSDYARIELAIVNSSALPKKKASILYQFFRIIEKRISKPTPDYLKPIEYKIKSPVLKVLPAYIKSRDLFSNYSVEEIEKYNLDVILRFGFRILSGKILTAAKYGVWSFHHGDYRFYRGMPAGFWEVVNDNCKTGAMLQVLTEDLDGGRIIRSATYQTHRVSPKRNANNVAAQAAHFLTEELKRLDETGKVRQEETIKIGKLYKAPTNMEMLRVFPTLLINKAKSLRKQPWQWQIAYKRTESPSFDFSSFKIAVPPNKNTFWADPFVIFCGGQHYVFYEELERGKKAHISCATIENGVFNTIGQVLNTGTHLSYPFVFFEHGYGYFMIPESMETGTIDLYWAKDFPAKWEKTRTLISGVYAADPTLVYWNDTYYLFATRGTKNLTNNSELYLWYSKRLFDGWKLHPASPIQNDISLARPAGKIFEYNGQLYRPSQDSIFCWVNLNKIRKLDALSYDEIKISEMRPPRNFAGLHTINYEAGLTVVDMLKK